MADKAQEKEKGKAEEKPEETVPLPPSAVEALEEDDEFEEFATEDWDKKAEDEDDVAQWQEDWDDQDIDDDFCNQLRRELQQSN